MAMSRFKVTKDADRFPAQGVIMYSPYIDARVLAANTAESHTIPTGAKVVVFSADQNFYARFGATAAIPAADVTDGTSPMLNPTARGIEDGVTTISLISPVACTVTMAFYV